MSDMDRVIAAIKMYQLLRSTGFTVYDAERRAWAAWFEGEA